MIEKVHDDMIPSINPFSYSTLRYIKPATAPSQPKATSCVWGSRSANSKSRRNGQVYAHFFLSHRQKRARRGGRACVRCGASCMRCGAGDGWMWMGILLLAKWVSMVSETVNLRYDGENGFVWWASGTGQAQTDELAT